MESYFEHVVETLTAAGYRWYETANFCRTRSKDTAGADLRARHNLGYWLGRDYLGIGVGAVSTIESRRWRNAPSLGRYVAALDAGPAAAARARGAAGRGARHRARDARPASRRAAAARRPGGEPRRARGSSAWPRLGLVVRGDGSLALTERGRFLGGGVTARLLASRGGRDGLPPQPPTMGAMRSCSPNGNATSSAAWSRSTSRPGSRSARRRSSSARARRLAVDRALRARRARAARAADASAHLRRAACRPRPGYRLYVDELLARPESRPADFALELPAARAEVEEALQATTEMLSQVTRLLALVSAPPLTAATVRHVEVLAAAADVVMVVVITSTGGVTKLRYAVPDAGRPGPRHLGGRVPERAARRCADRLARGQARLRRAGPRRCASGRSCS